MKRLFLTLFLLFPSYSYAEDNLSQSLWWKDYRDKNGGVDPVLVNRMVFDINSDNSYNSSNTNDQFVDTIARFYFDSRLKLSDNFLVKSNLRMERARKVSEDDRRSQDINGGGSRTLEDTNVNIRELTLNYKKDKATIFAGKFVANFGNAWKIGRGIWTRELTIQYRQENKLGVGAKYQLGDVKKTGLYNFGFSAFTNDRKNLDNSIFTKRDSDYKYERKAGDTRSLESYVASMDIKFEFDERFGEKERLFYHFAYLNLAADEKNSTISQTKIDDQKGFVANGKYRYPFTKNVTLDGLVEYVDLKNLNGDSDVGDRYVNASLIGEFYHNWNVTLAATNIKHTVVGENGYDRRFAEISAGYKFDKNSLFDEFLIQAGYKNLNTDYKTSVTNTRSYGVLARYIKIF